MKVFAAIGLGLALSAAGPARAIAVTDCPLRDVPFSADSPLVDLMPSRAAKAVIEHVSPDRLARLLERQSRTTPPPTFGATMTVRTASLQMGIDAATLSGQCQTNVAAAALPC